MIDIIKRLRLKKPNIPTNAIEPTNQTSVIMVTNNVVRAVLCFVSFNLTVILILTYLFCKYFEMFWLSRKIMENNDVKQNISDYIKQYNPYNPYDSYD